MMKRIPIAAGLAALLLALTACKNWAQVGVHTPGATDGSNTSMSKQR